jgi:hypothetical protein
MSRLPAPACALLVGFGALLLVVGAGPARAQSPDPALKQVGTVDHPPVDEMSGIVKSPQFDNVWWVHNDSGDRPRLFAIDSVGAVHLAPWRADSYAAGPAAADTSGEPAWPGLALGNAAHIDYEDMAVEDSVLYVGDIGNNGNARRDLGIYVVPEPFYYARRTRPMEYLRIRYPDQTTYPAEKWDYDAESLFVDDGTLYILTKRRKGQKIGELDPGTTLYRLDTEHPHRVNTLTIVDRHPTIAPPTAAALSPSGDRLAVLCTTGVWVFPRPADGARWLSTEPRRLPLPEGRLQQAEAVTWDDAQTLRITNENRDVFVLPLTERPAGTPAAAKD